jgi:hypothetical protein
MLQATPRIRVVPWISASVIEVGIFLLPKIVKVDLIRNLFLRRMHHEVYETSHARLYDTDISHGWLEPTARFGN